MRGDCLAVAAPSLHTWLSCLLWGFSGRWQPSAPEAVPIGCGFVPQLGLYTSFGFGVYISHSMLRNTVRIAPATRQGIAAGVLLHGRS